ncbi:hypothetical protein [Streptomyces albipurpureus]|uniref:Secreted protein n=1 Tax=Streptomyces albipurpureus TaxID=2897419 RepID=A0ABT0UQ44_9ACTN|nr:hypothetical protein [Streptomyces sp. CWNU-1]MCM2390366.1 hypothetical protein [Streptomyces sp. CWNU-1]
MQTSAVPDLAHTQTRPVHWLATAAAMAAVVGFAGLLPTGPAIAKEPASKPGSAIAAAPAPAPDPAAVRLPLECPGVPSVVIQRATGDLDGDDKPETVVAARCDAGSGTPPAGVFVLTAAGDRSIRVVATLVEPGAKRSVTDLSIREGAITATLLGYSSMDVPSCCPDERESVKWRWQGGKFVRTTEAALDRAL